LVAVVLGLNVKEAATLGMIDKLSLSERGSALATEKQMSIDNDDSLFVSEGENDADPQPTATTATPPGAGPATVFGSRATDSQPSTNSNPFSSLFAANSTTSTTSSSPSLNPFAKPFTPFSSETSQTSQPVIPSPAATSTGQSSSIFANAGSAGIFAPSQNEKPSTAPAAAPFKFPTISQPATSQTPPTLFQNIQKSTTSPTPTFDASQSTLRVTPDQPSWPTTQSQNTPFATSSSPFSVKPDQPSDAAAGQSSTSISSIAKPTFESQSPLLNLNKPSESSPTASELQATPEGSNSQPAAFAPRSSLQSGSELHKKGMRLP
jgi:hypothetical protein